MYDLETPPYHVTEKVAVAFHYCSSLDVLSSVKDSDSQEWKKRKVLGTIEFGGGVQRSFLGMDAPIRERWTLIWPTLPPFKIGTQFLSLFRT